MNSRLIEPIMVQSVVAQGMDELRQVARGWDLDMVQLERGAMASDTTTAVTSQVIFQKAWFSLALHQMGSAPPGRITFGIPADLQQRFLWRGKEVLPDRILVFGPDTELDSFSRSGFHVFIVSITPSHLNALAHQLALPELATLERGDLVLSCDPAAMDKLRYFLNDVVQGVNKVASPEDRQIAATLINNEVPRQVMETVASGRFVPETPSPRHRTQALRKAVDYMSEHARDAPTIRDVAVATGFTMRTLQNAFQEHFEVSPKRYILSRRLKGVHQELQQAEPGDTKIVDLANEWGFWHMGQFAADYRKQFKELPSATLNHPG